MKAAMWYGKNDVRLVDVPEPSPKPGEVKIKIKWCGICGSDLHEYLAGPISIPVGTPNPVTGEMAPVIIGHELAGDIVEVGSGVTHLKAGDRVTLETPMGCMKCPSCKEGMFNVCENIGIFGVMGGGGGFAEYTTIRAGNVHVLPDALSYERATLVEPISCGFQGMVVGGFKPGMAAVVMGAGPIGLGTIESLKASGARKIFAVVRKSVRQEYALRAGADYLIDPTETDVASEVRRLNGGVGADIAFETFGADVGIEYGISCLRVDGTLVVLSLWEEPLKMNMMNVVIGQKRMVGSAMYNYNTFETVAQMLSDGRMKAEGYITKRIALEDLIEEGFKTMTGPDKKKHVKIIVTPDRSLL